MNRIKGHFHVPLQLIPRETMRCKKTGWMKPNPQYKLFLQHTVKRNGQFYLDSEMRGLRVFTGLAGLK